MVLHNKNPLLLFYGILHAVLNGSTVINIGCNASSKICIAASLAQLKVVFQI